MVQRQKRTVLQKSGWVAFLPASQGPPPFLVCSPAGRSGALPWSTLGRCADQAHCLHRQPAWVNILMVFPEGQVGQGAAGCIRTGFSLFLFLAGGGEGVWRAQQASLHLVDLWEQEETETKAPDGMPSSKILGVKSTLCAGSGSRPISL